MHDISPVAENMSSCTTIDLCCDLPCIRCWYYNVYKMLLWFSQHCIFGMNFYYYYYVCRELGYGWCNVGSWLAQSWVMVGGMLGHGWHKVG